MTRMDTGGLFGVDADCYEYFVHRFTQMDTDGCPQADDVGERESSEFKRN